MLFDKRKYSKYLTESKRKRKFKTISDSTIYKYDGEYKDKKKHDCPPQNRTAETLVAFSKTLT